MDKDKAGKVALCLSCKTFFRYADKGSEDCIECGSQSVGYFINDQYFIGYLKKYKPWRKGYRFLHNTNEIASKVRPKLIKIR